MRCEKCGGEMVEKNGRFGKFTACSNFPNCKNILRDSGDKPEAEKTGIPCDRCSDGELVVRDGKFGKFLACSRYPKCKNTKKINPEEGSPKKDS